MKTQKAQLEFKIQSEMEKAKDLKVKLQTLGYASLEDAKKDYALRKENITKMERELDNLIEQIKQVEFKPPTREEIFSFVNLGDKQAIVSVAEEKPPAPIPAPVQVQKIAEPEMFANIENLL